MSPSLVILSEVFRIEPRSESTEEPDNFLKQIDLLPGGELSLVNVLTANQRSK